jgi:hypothetical protein
VIYVGFGQLLQFHGEYQDEGKQKGVDFIQSAMVVRTTIFACLVVILRNVCGDGIVGLLEIMK